MVEDLLKNLRIKIKESMRLYCGNKFIVNLANNLVMWDWMMHVDIDFYFIKNKIDGKKLVLTYVKSMDQLIDIFTKGDFYYWIWK